MFDTSNVLTSPTSSPVFIVTNDIHYRGSNPRSRIDSYKEAIISKLYKVWSLARDMRATAILIAGDLTDSPSLSYSAISDLGQALQSAPCPILTIAGQHDEGIGHRPEDLYRTPYGLLVRLGIIQDVCHSPCVVDGSDIVITGRHYDEHADEEDYYMADKRPEARGLRHIHLAHGLVLTSRPPWDGKYTLAHELRTNADVLCVGDYHSGIGAVEKNEELGEGKGLIINPGALSRVKASEEEMERTVKVAALTMGHRPSAEMIDIGAAPGREVLSREHIEREKERRQKMSMADDFLYQLKNASMKDGLSSVESIVRMVGEQQGYDKAIIDKGLERMEIVRRRMEINLRGRLN